jgi:hypothetical protein
VKKKNWEQDHRGEVYSGGRERLICAYLFKIVTQGKAKVKDFFVAQK